MKKVFKYDRIILIGALLVGFSGCEFKKPSDFSGGRTAVVHTLAKEAAFFISMDEESYVLALHPPAETKNVTDGNMFLKDYQYCTEEFSIDKNGDITNSVKYLEGNSDIRMPSAIWDETKDIRPSVIPNGYTITKMMMANGIVEFLGPNGVVYTQEYDPEEFRVDPNTIDSLFITPEDTTAKMAAERLKQLVDEGINYTLLDSFLVRIDAVPDDEYYSKISSVVNLKTGLTMKRAVYDKNGNFDSFSYSYYQYINDFPVEVETISYEFGEVKNSWQAKTVTLTTRKNILVSRNSG